ncbi:unnamed protein product [Rotaria sp. Silwood1]|nr:unnamed protein product [Rotaria sp. Silwood1]CAF1503746.1 unnamed protein product [Rotaria sp. Silwood1]CAF1512074.1 unnamed protein product [Rotaria sp. Silwood1]CAF3616647.1 unnamed protein product [Rotaria sp. Silwood1]CAF3631538.1 unnamed protein product [Rotaria sp. Silwood1]
MALLLQHHNSSIKSNIKPKEIVQKNPSRKTEIEFRWSISAAKIALQEEASLAALHIIDLNSPKKKSFLSSQPSTARSLVKHPSSFSTYTLSPSSSRLSNENNINKKKRELSISPIDQNHDERKSPLIVTYAQLHREQQNLKQMETSQTNLSIYPLLNNKQRNISNIYRRLPHLSKSTASSKLLQRLAMKKYKK